MIEALQWASLMGSAAALAGCGLCCGLVLCLRRSARAQARRRGAAAARAAIWQYWRAADRDIRELATRLETLESRRHEAPALRIATDPAA